MDPDQQRIMKLVFMNVHEFFNQIDICEEKKGKKMNHYLSNCC